MNHYVSGATGFIGSALVVELLMRTDDHVVAMARPGSDETSDQRLRRILFDLVDGYELPDGLFDAIVDRVTVIDGDLDLAHCGVDVARHRFETGGEFWHCAASLQYQDRHRQAIDRTNIGGTANALDLAEALRCRMFNMVSTAYVAGRRRGLVPAVPGDLDLVNNLYERSKILAEQQVRLRAIPHRMMRPGVVIGHSTTRHTTSSDGLYGFLRGLRKFRAVLDRTQAGLSERLEVRVLADASGCLDLVPVDHVVADAVALSAADAPIGIYHLTNGTPANIGESLATVFGACGLQPPLIVDSTEGFTSTDTRLRERLDFYNSYIVNGKSFDRTSVHEVLGDRASTGLTLPPEVLGTFCRRYLDGTARPVATVGVGGSVGS